MLKIKTPSMAFFDWGRKNAVLAFFDEVNVIFVFRCFSA